VQISEVTNGVSEYVSQGLLGEKNKLDFKVTCKTKPYIQLKINSNLKEEWSN